MSDRRANRNLAGSAGRIGRFVRLALAGLGAVTGVATARDCASGAEPALVEPLRVAVYDVPPYGYVDAGGSIAGVAGCFLSVPMLATLRIIYRQLLIKAPPTVVAPDGAITK